MSTVYPINVYKSAFKEEHAKKFEVIANLSIDQKWSELIQMLKQHKSFVNCCRLSTEDEPPPELYTPLHQAAKGSAPKEVFEELLNLGASKTLQTAVGETAYDIGKQIALDQDILNLIAVPVEVKQNAESIQKMQDGLHKTILGRVVDLVEKDGLKLPQLAFLYEFGSFWYVVPGMYGGFNVEKHADGIQTESWCRVVGGSGQRHVIDRQGEVKMTAEGFV